MIETSCRYVVHVNKETTNLVILQLVEPCTYQDCTSFQLYPYIKFNSALYASTPYSLRKFKWLTKILETHSIYLPFRFLFQSLVQYMCHFPHYYPMARLITIQYSTTIYTTVN